MRGLRLAAVLALCAFACAKRPGGTQSPDDAHAGVDAAGDAAAPGAGGAARDFEAPADAIDQEVTSPIVGSASLEAMTAELDRFEAELRHEGVRLRTYRKAGKIKDHPPRKPDKTPTKPTTTPGDAASKKAEDPCARICTIATTVCELRDRICVLAEDHEDEPRYAAACKRASNDCTRATEACEDCA